MSCLSNYLRTVLLVAATLAANSTLANEDHCAAKASVLKQMQQDTLFTKPYVDVDEWREKPVRHRYIHGGFENTATRFSYYFPAEQQYEGRFFQYITPLPIDEFVSQGRSGEDDKIGFSIDSGAYFIETNGGGKRLVGRPGVQVDPTIAGYRANAAAAQYSRILAMQMYGCRRPFGYAFGGSGGAYRTAGGMENTEGVWDGAVPFVIGSPMAIPNVFTVRSYALRVLKDKLPAIADAVDVGSETNPYQLLNEEEAKAFKEVTSMGFPVEAWYVYNKLDLHGFAVLFAGIVAADPGYFSEDFWTKAGYEGFKPPASLEAEKIEHRTTIEQLVMAEDVESSGLRAVLRAGQSRGLADDAFKELLGSSSEGLPIAIKLASVPNKDTLGADVIVKTGVASGQRLLVTKKLVGNYLIVGKEAGKVLSELKVGDELEFNNLNFLASQTYHRHQVPAEGYPVWDQFRDEEGNPIYPQRPMILGPLFARSAAGTVPSGKFNGKMILLSNLYDTEAYPWQGDWYREQAESHLGTAFDSHFRLWYTDRANHGDAGGQLVPTQTVSYLGVLQQALRDVSAWVEKDIEPPSTTNYKIVDGQVQVPSGANERGGIQPVIQLFANGATRAEVGVGEAVELSANVLVPKGTGVVVAADWDFDGSGTFSAPAHLDPKGGESATLKASHTYNEPGTYFIVLRVASQRNGDINTPYTLVRNLGRVRVVVE
jgi:hypothetical protein